MSILVTGASGFIGLNLLELLLRKGEEVVAFSHDAVPDYALNHLASLEGSLECLRGDVSNPDTVQSLFAGRNISHVVHGATITAGPQLPPTQAERVLKVNITGTQLMLQAAQQASVKRFVLVSSSAVNGDAPFEPQRLDEMSATRPLGLYGYTKLASEQLAELWRQQHGLDVVTARLTAIFGPWERDTGVRGTLSPPFQLAMQALHGSPSIISAHGQRDWTLSTDIAAGICTLLFAPARQHPLYNLASGELWHTRLLCQALQAVFPRWTWQESTDELACSVQYNDDLSRPRISPLLGERYSREFQAAFTPAAQAVERYAQWVQEHARFLNP